MVEFQVWKEQKNKQLTSSFVERFVELNGHAINVYNNRHVNPKKKTIKSFFNFFLNWKMKETTPAIRFDLKEILLVKAFGGLPRQSLQKDFHSFGIISRYHFNQATGSYIYFFKCYSAAEVNDWIKYFYINLEWAKRFSAMFYPRGSMKVTWDPDKNMLISEQTKETYVRNSRLHARVFFSF